MMAMRACFLVFFCWYVAFICTSWGADDVAESKKWSFQFENVPVADVLDQLSRETGVRIVASKLPEKKVFTRSYKDASLGQIIQDLFRGMSYAVIWHKGEDGAETADVWISEGGSDRIPRGSSRVTNTSEGYRPSRPARATPVTRRSFGRSVKQGEGEEDESDDNAEEEEMQEQEQGTTEEVEEQQNESPAPDPFLDRPVGTFGEL